MFVPPFTTQRELYWIILLLLRTSFVELHELRPRLPLNAGFPVISRQQWLSANVIHHCNCSAARIGREMALERCTEGVGRRYPEGTHSRSQLGRGRTHSLQTVEPRAAPRHDPHWRTSPCPATRDCVIWVGLHYDPVLIRLDGKLERISENPKLFNTLSPKLTLVRHHSKRSINVVKPCFLHKIAAYFDRAAFPRIPSGASGKAFALL